MFIHFNIANTLLSSFKHNTTNVVIHHIHLRHLSLHFTMATYSIGCRKPLHAFLLSSRRHFVPSISKLILFSWSPKKEFILYSFSFLLCPCYVFGLKSLKILTFFFIMARSTDSTRSRRSAAAAPSSAEEQVGIHIGREIHHETVGSRVQSSVSLFIFVDFSS